MTKIETLRAEQKKIEKDLGPQIGKLSGAIKKASGDEAAALQKELDAIKAKPAALKDQIAQAEPALAAIEPELNALLLQVPLPPDADVPVGKDSSSNVEIKRWSPSGYD
ncbi:MAG: hypothetical protein ACK58T_41640, partial [Phycisphaerae bacterium]